MLFEPHPTTLVDARGPDAVLDLFAHRTASALRRYDAGTVLSLPNDGKWLVIVDGEITVFVVTPQGGSLAIADLKRGDLILPTPAEAELNLECRSSVTAILLEFVDVDRMLSTRTGREALYAHLKLFSQTAIARLIDALGSTMRARLHAELLRLAPECGGRRVIEDLPTHEEIARRIYGHREAITKELSRLARLGAIRRRGTRLDLIRPDLLSHDTAGLADSPPACSRAA